VSVFPPLDQKERIARSAGIPFDFGTFSNVEHRGRGAFEAVISVRVLSSACSWRMTEFFPRPEAGE
jgi:hypothetical protein